MPLVPYNSQVAKQHQLNTHHVCNLAETCLVDSIKFRGWMDAAWMIKNLPLKSLKAKFGPNNEATPQICRINLIHKIQTSYPHITHQQFPNKAQRVEFGLFDSTHPWVPGEFDLAQWYGHCEQTVVQLWHRWLCLCHCYSILSIVYVCVCFTQAHWWRSMGVRKWDSTR